MNKLKYLALAVVATGGAFAGVNGDAAAGTESK